MGNLKVFTVLLLKYKFFLRYFNKHNLPVNFFFFFLLLIFGIFKVSLVKEKRLLAFYSFICDHLKDDQKF